MNEPVELSPIFEKCITHQQQLDAAFTQLSSELSLSAINRLKAQILLLSDWLFTLSEQNSDIILAKALRHSSSFLPHTNQAFVAAVVMAKFTHRLHYHGQHGRLLISAALTMNISHLTSKNGLSDVLYKNSKLNTDQLKKYHQYPLLSTQFLNKYDVIDKAALHWVLGHRELLDGSGFPAQLKQHKIPFNMQLLGIIARFTELTSPRENRACARIKQVMSYLLKHQHHFNIHLIHHLISLIDKPLPGFIYTLNKTQSALIISNDVLNDEHEYIVFSIDEGALNLDEKHQKSAIDYQRQYSTAPSNFSDRILGNYLSDYRDEPFEDLSDQTQRLKPNKNLSLLLTELESAIHDKNAISTLIEQQPVLGERLINQLQKQFPTSQFNSSYHAMQMIGFKQVHPLLGRLALDAQLSSFKFLTSDDLNQKINCAVNISQVIGNSCQHVLPNQLAMFTQLNLSPLYLEHRVINSQARQKVKFKKCNIHHGFSLAGISNTPKQQKVSTALTKMWAPQKSFINALNCIINPDLPRNAKIRELISGFELAIYLTHSIFHDISLTDKVQDNHFKMICRDLKLTPKDINELQQTTLANHPLCSLQF